MKRLERGCFGLVRGGGGPGVYRVAKVTKNILSLGAHKWF